MHVKSNMSERPTFKSGQLIVRSDGFVAAHGRYITSEVGKRCSAFVNEKRYTSKETEVTSRIAHYWEKAGLIDDTRPGGKGWRKFSLMDLLMLRVFTELRFFGLSIEKLLKVKESLESKKAEHTPYPILEFYVVRAMAYREPTYLLVFKDGTAEPVSHAQFRQSLKYLSLADHVHLSINRALQHIMPSKDFSPEYGKSIDVTDEEFEFFFLLRTGNYDTIKVKRKGGRIDTIEAEETVTEERIADIMDEADFQDIEIKRQDGKTVCIKRTVKKKL